MASTLNGETLNILGLQEMFDMIAIQYPKWVPADSEVQMQIKPYGVKKMWTISCYEKGVAWSSSIAKDFDDLAHAGTTVALVLDVGSVGAGKLHSLSSTNVKINNVEVSYDAEINGVDYREYTINLEAV